MGKTGQNRAWEGAGKMPGTLMHVTVAKDLNNVKKQTSLQHLYGLTTPNCKYLFNLSAP